LIKGVERVKLGILHLSDIHIKEDFSDSEKWNKIGDAFNNPIYSDLSTLFIVITGDIAYSGKKEQYDLVADLISTLRSNIGLSLPNTECKTILIPGNHDCDFALATKVREIVISNLTGNLDDAWDQSYSSTCCSVQKHFFDFMSKVTGNSILSGDNQIFFKSEFGLGDRTIRFNCINTAWVSRRKEKQGELIFPTFLIEEDNSPCDLSISIFHHPTNWLQATNAREFKLKVEKISDIILTGHEHTSTLSTLRKESGEVVELLEGGALHGDDWLSEFNVLVINLEKKERKKWTYEWSESLYICKNESSWDKYERGKYLTGYEFELNKNFKEYLYDPGANFTHPIAGKVSLPEMFIWPTLRIVSAIQNVGSIRQEIVEENSEFEYMLESGSLIILGEDKSGKTSLAKMLFLELLKKDLVPIFLNGDQISTPNPDKLHGIIEEKFSKQYSEDRLEKFRQLPKTSRAVIVDDFDKIELNHRGKSILIDLLSREFSKIYFVSNGFVQIEELVEKGAAEGILLKFDKCQILDFGNHKRWKLIQRWHSIGKEYSASEEEISYHSKISENLINTIIGKNLLPPRPLYVLIILQNLEAVKTLTIPNGSFGYFYELLITEALSKTSNQIDLDSKYNFLSELSYRLYEMDKREISEAQFKDFFEFYSKKYDINFSLSEINKDLIKSRIIEITEIGNYRFKYKYITYYFTARFFSQMLQHKTESDKAKEQISKMISHVYKEKYANIIVFLSYLSKDPFVLQEMLKSAKGIYSDTVPCNLADHIGFLETVAGPNDKLEISIANPMQNKEKLLKEIDRNEVQPVHRREDMDAEEQITEDVLGLNLALKTLQILGQTLRNFPGSRPAEEKYELGVECYNLGLRVLNKFLGLIKDNMEDLKEGLSSFLKENKHYDTEADLKRGTDHLIYLLCTLTCQGIVKQISNSVGSEKLDITFRKILASTDMVSFRLIDVTIKLDHYKNIPRDEILKLFEDTKRLKVPNMILKQFVASHFYIYPSKYDTRQQICDKLGIQLQKGKLFSQKEKRITNVVPKESGDPDKNTPPQK
jgi:hypothetical protein